MRAFLLGLSISIAFIVGCLAGQVITPSAQAEPGATRWEHVCEQFMSLYKVQEWLNEQGARGFEVAAAGQNAWCMKRAVTK